MSKFWSWETVEKFLGVPGPELASALCSCSSETFCVDAHGHQAESTDILQVSTSGSLQEVSMRYRWTELENCTDGFKATRVLGQGRQGTVYRGTLEEGVDVAIKVVDTSFDESFREEIQSLARCHHPNIVLLIGFATRVDEDGPFSCHGSAHASAACARSAVVYEFLPGGSLEDRLRRTNVPFPWNLRLRTAVQVAQGLVHLHRLRPQVFHRDVKSAHILFGADNVAKLADFGLLCLSPTRGGNGPRAGGTPGYTAPEYAQAGMAMDAAEVYSFGMVLLELLTAMPAAQLTPDGVTEIYLVDTIRPDMPGATERVLTRSDPHADWPEHVAAGLAELILSCLHRRPDWRPAAMKVVATLLELLGQPLGNRSEHAGLATDGPGAAADHAERSPPSSTSGTKMFSPVADDGHPPVVQNMTESFFGEYTVDLAPGNVVPFAPLGSIRRPGVSAAARAAEAYRREGMGSPAAFAAPAHESCGLANLAEVDRGGGNGLAGMVDMAATSGQGESPAGEAALPEPQLTSQHWQPEGGGLRGEAMTEAGVQPTAGDGTSAVEGNSAGATEDAGSWGGDAGGGGDSGSSGSRRVGNWPEATPDCCSRADSQTTPSQPPVEEFGAPAPATPDRAGAGGLNGRTIASPTALKSPHATADESGMLPGERRLFHICEVGDM